MTEGLYGRPQPPEGSCKTFQIPNEGHTLGNSLRFMLNKKYVSSKKATDGTRFVIVVKFEGIRSPSEHLVGINLKTPDWNDLCAAPMFTLLQAPVPTHPTIS
jgi:hypothetical protein